MKISVVQGHHEPLSRATQNGIRYHQLAYADLGGAYPAEVRIPLASAAAAYPVGEYLLSPRSYRVGKYGDLEINNFQIILDPLSKPSTARAAS